MKKVAVITEAFGFGVDREPLYTDEFRSRGLEPVFAELQEIWEQLDTFEGVIFGVEKADKPFFDKATNLSVAMKFGVGLDNFDIEYAAEKSVAIANLPGINSDSVSEMVLGLMLDVSRKISETNASYKSGKLHKELGSNVINKTLGVLGSGAIGREVMKIVSGLNMKVLAYDAVMNNETVELGAEYVSLERLFAESDFITAHIPLNGETYHFIGGDEFKQMKSTAVIINTARGGIVDENALARAVKNGDIAGAGLDVFEQYEVNKQFLDLPTVVCTPHISAYTGETLRKMEMTAIEKMAKLLV